MPNHKKTLKLPSILIFAATYPVVYHRYFVGSRQNVIVSLHETYPFDEIIRNGKPKALALQELRENILDVTIESRNCHTRIVHAPIGEKGLFRFHYLWLHAHEFSTVTTEAHTNTGAEGIITAVEPFENTLPQYQSEGGVGHGLSSDGSQRGDSNSTKRVYHTIMRARALDRLSHWQCEVLVQVCTQ